MSAAPVPVGMPWDRPVLERKRALEALLRDRRLQADAPPLRGEDRRLRPLAIGIAELDALLGGGFARGEVSEIHGPASSGRTGVLLALLAGTTRTGALAALVDPLDRLDPASAAAAGVDLARLLWLRGPRPRGYAGWLSGAGPRGYAGWPSGASPRGYAGWLSGAGTEEPPAQALADATAAVATLVSSGLFDVVALDLAGAERERRRLPATTWLRLQRLVETTATGLVLVAEGHVSCSPGGQALALEPAGPRWSGPPGPARLLQALAVRARGGRHGLRTAELALAAL